MLGHIKKCPNMSSAQKALAGIVPAASDAPMTVGSSRSQSKLSRFMPLQDTAYTDTEQGKLNQLFLRATVSANLPYSWVADEHVEALFKFVKPTIQLPDRRNVAGQCLI